MTNIANHYPLTGLSNRHNSHPSYQSALYEKEVSVRTHESLSSGIMIETSDGDKVTLTSNSFSHMDSYMYDSKGMVKTESGMAAFSQSYREMILASGQSFTFSVEGDLSEEELADIESILKGLDRVTQEVKDGDISGAMEEALEIGQFDSISAYSADIRYQSSYEMSSSVAAATTQVLPAGGEGNNSEKQPEKASELSPGKTQKNNPFFSPDKFLSKLLKQFESHTKNNVAQAKNPVDQLFKHHLDELGKIEEEVDSLFTMMEKAFDEVNAFIDEIESSLFGETLEEKQLEAGSEIEDGAEVEVENEEADD